MSNGKIIGPLNVPANQKGKNSGVWDAEDVYSAISKNSWSTDVVRNGLTLYLDATNPSSYPGSGTSWYDLSPTGLTFTGDATFMSSSNGLRSGSTWSSASTSILNTDTHSLFFNIRFNSTTTWPQSYVGGWEKIFGYNPAGTDRSPGIWRYPSERKIHWRYDTGNSGADLAERNWADLGGEQFAMDTWYYVGVVKNGATATMYVNGSSIGTATVTNPKAAGNSAIYLFEYYTASIANIDFIKVYNRAISSEEVSINYKANQSRLSSIPAAYLVVGGGGGGGMDMGGGGGAGGYLSGNASLSFDTTYSVSVGSGGSGAPAAGTNGQNTGHMYNIPAKSGKPSMLFGSNVNLLAFGGGFGGSSYQGYSPGIHGGPGGSGGGCSGYNDNAGTFAGGAGVSGQGNRGGNSTAAYYSGGGGGAGAQGSDSTSQADGGVGIQNSILGTNYFFAGGGGGAGYSIEGGNGGNGGGGAGGTGTNTGGSGLNAGASTSGGGVNSWANVPGGNGGANTGGGGGGGSHYNSNNKGGDGGSGIVVVRYPDYYPDLVNITSLTYTRTLVAGHKIYSFTQGTGTFTTGRFASETPLVQYLIVGGGGGGVSGGGGGGGVISGSIFAPKTASITVGAGGAGGVANGGSGKSNGSNSSFAGVVALGGGHGGNNDVRNASGTGGNGGGGGSTSTVMTAGGDGIQGYSGGYVMNSYYASPFPSAGGGGAGANGSNPTGSSTSGNGGVGVVSTITNESIYYGGGGGGSTWSNGTHGSGGAGGGGAGAYGNGVAGTANTGGGGGGGAGGAGGTGGAGGSGIVILKYPDTYLDLSVSGLTYQSFNAGGYRIYKFTAGSGTVTFM